MLKLSPLLLALIYGLGMFYFSMWRTQRLMAQNSKLLDDPVLTQTFGKLRNALNLRRLNVFVYNVAPINGFAAPDGNVYLTQGFIDAFHRGEFSADEVASVVAHELGHLALGHTRRRIIDFTGQNAVRTVLAMYLSRFLPGIGIWTANFLSSLLAARLSRTDEFEADEYATALMIKAGFGAGPQKSMFDKLGHKNRHIGNTTPAWLLSHPDTKDRIRAIEVNETKWSQI